MRQSVYILGAGASKDFGLPLGVEIFDCAYKLSKLKDKSGATNELATVLGDVERYMGEIFTNLPKDKMDYPPLEEILTFLWDCRNAETTTLKAKDRVPSSHIRIAQKGSFPFSQGCLG